MGGAEQVLAEDLGARGVDDRRLDRAVEELLRVAGEELVKRVLAGNVDGQATAAAAGAAPHLAQAGDGAREGDADRGVELADVDPELERVGRDHAEQLARDQARLDLVALLRGVAGAVRGDALGQLGRQPVEAMRRISSTPLRDFMKQIVRAPAVISSASSSAASASAEARMPSFSSSSGGFQIATWRDGSGAVSLSTRLMSGRPVSFCGELDRVGDRRAGEQEAGLRAVDRGRAAQSAQDVGDVRAEDATVDVSLVDHDEREVREQVTPARVVGQDPDVEHVGVGDHEVRAAADRGALL